MATRRWWRCWPHWTASVFPALSFRPPRRTRPSVTRRDREARLAYARTALPAGAEPFGEVGQLGALVGRPRPPAALPHLVGLRQQGPRLVQRSRGHDVRVRVSGETRKPFETGRDQVRLSGGVPDAADLLI